MQTHLPLTAHGFYSRTLVDVTLDEAAQFTTRDSEKPTGKDRENVGGNDCDALQLTCA
jgi:hypothetical protein